MDAHHLARADARARPTPLARSSIDGTLEPWTKQLFSVLEEHVLVPLPLSHAFIPDDQPLPPLLRFDPGSPNRSRSNAGSSIETSRTAVVQSNERMTHPKHFQDVRLLTLTAPAADPPFE